MCIGYQRNKDDHHLTIKSFYVRLEYFSRKQRNSHSLTLHYLPRVNLRALEINGSRVRPNSAAFVTLHRVISPEKATRGVAAYGSIESVRANEGLRFEIYMECVKVLTGIFRKGGGQNWKIECIRDDVEGVKDADVCVVLEGDVAVISEKVKRRNRERRRCSRLERIPEEREVEKDECESEGCGSPGCEGGGGDEVEMDGGDFEMEGVKWALDVGVWVVCFGAGYLLSKASSKTLRKILF